MKCKVLAHKFDYKKKTYSAGDIVDLKDGDPCTKVLIRIGRVKPVDGSAAKKPAKKAAKKKAYKRRDLKAED